MKTKVLSKLRMRSLAIALLFMMGTIAHAEEARDSVSVGPNQIVVEVHGIVCSFCAYGTEKNLSKIAELDKSQFGDGVLMNIYNQQITLAVKPGRSVKFDEVYAAIKKGGYDPAVVHLQIHGIPQEVERNIIIADTSLGYSFRFPISDGTRFPLNQPAIFRVQFDAREIPSFQRGDPIDAKINGVVRKEQIQ